MKRKLFVCFAAAVLPSIAQDKSLRCDSEGRNNGRSQKHCEMREYNVPAATRAVVDGRTNGGVSVKGWNQSGILVRARVETWAPTIAEAQSLAGQVNVQTAGANISADAPDFGRDRGWSVSYEVFVPNRIDLSLKARNGGIHVADVAGNIEFDALNGGVNLARLGGDIRGRTTNGGLKIELTGSRWEGNQLDVSTTNGGVSMVVPENYSARLETSTVNGRVSFDFPVTVQGKIGNQMSLNLGNGGPLIRATTTNGGVSIKRKS